MVSFSSKMEPGRASLLLENKFEDYGRSKDEQTGAAGSLYKLAYTPVDRLRKEIETRAQSAMSGNMDKKTIIVFAVVGSLGLLSGILAFSGEGTKLNVS